MSLEAIQKVTQTEQNAEGRKAEALASSKKIIAEARSTGQAQQQALRQSAEEASKKLLTEAETRAAKHADQVMAETAQACQALRQSARGRLSNASALIVERVVSV